MTDQPIISVIVSTYNSERFIRGRIEDLVRQTIFSRIEVIVVDSGSTQGERTIVEEFARQFANIIYLRTDEREPIYAAWNRAIRVARGVYITNANTDDRLRRDALEVLSGELRDHPEWGMVYADQYISTVENETFEEVTNTRYRPWNDFQFDRLLEGCFTGPQPMWRSSLHHADGIWFDERYEIAGDYEFACNVATRYPLGHVHRVLGVYYRSPAMSNKELQNLDRTFSETYDIKCRYADLHLRTLTDEELYQKLTYYRTWVERPAVWYLLWKLVMKVIRPLDRLPVREFAIWYLARMYRYIGRTSDALSICKKYDPAGTSRLLSAERESLQSIPRNAPAISVVIPTFNRPELLSEALRSVAEQTHPPYEVIVVNNGTVDVDHIIERFRDCMTVRLFRSEVQGAVAAAKNVALREVRGTHVAFLDDDDWYHPLHLATLYDGMVQSGCSIVYSDAWVEFQELRDGRLTTVKRIVQYSRDFSRTLLLIKDYIFTPCIMLEKKCLDVVGNFDESLRTDEDFDLWIRMSKFYTFHHIATITCSVRRSNSVESLTRDWGMMIANARYVYRKHRALAGMNPLVKLGQWYYVNLRKRRAKASGQGGYVYKY